MRQWKKLDVKKKKKKKSNHTLSRFFIIFRKKISVMDFFLTYFMRMNSFFFVLIFYFSFSRFKQTRKIVQCVMGRLIVKVKSVGRRRGWAWPSLAPQFLLFATLVLSTIHPSSVRRGNETVKMALLLPGSSISLLPSFPQPMASYPTHPCEFLISTLFFFCTIYYSSMAWVWFVRPFNVDRCVTSYEAVTRFCVYFSSFVCMPCMCACSSAPLFLFVSDLWGEIPQWMV